MDQSGESREEQSHRVPHPGGEKLEDGVGRGKRMRSSRCWREEKEEEGVKGRGGSREEKGSTDSVSCWKSSGLHPVGIREKESVCVLGEREKRRRR